MILSLALPDEVYHEIILAIYEQSVQARNIRPQGFCREMFTSDCSSPLCKPEWSTFDALSKISRSIRRITLRAWFRILRIRNAEDWSQFQTRYPAFISTVKGLVWFEPDVDQYEEAKATCHRFTKLLSVGIYLKRTCEEQPDIETLFNALPRPIETLEVFNTLYPDYAFARAIAKLFPGLRTLRLAQPAIWCSFCFTCNIPYAELSDDRNETSLTYQSSIGLPTTFSQIFASLKRLRCVKITTSTLPGYYPLFDPGQLVGVDNWSGECLQCAILLRSDRLLEDKRRRDKAECEYRPLSVSWDFINISDFGEDWANRLLTFYSEPELLT